MVNLKETFSSPIQIGLLVRDLDTVLKNFETILGMDHFRIADFPPSWDPDVVREYQGKKGDFKAKFCFYLWKNIEFEIIQPLEGENIWNDFLNEKGGIGLHHIKFAVESHAPVEEYFASLGIPVIQKGEGVGPNAGREWRFYDTFDQLGFDLEMINLVVE